MVVLTIIFVPACHLLLFRLLLLHGDFIHLRRNRLLRLRIDCLVMLCHVILLRKVVSDHARSPGSPGALSLVPTYGPSIYAYARKIGSPRIAA